MTTERYQRGLDRMMELVSSKKSRLYSGFGVVGHRAEEPIVIATC
jgi:hypothetical protein